jgi:hypothetical protein
MRPLALIVLATLALAGCDRAIELELVRAPEAADLDVDLSCIRSADVFAIPNDLTASDTYACVDLATGVLRTLDDHDLAGALDMAAPSSGPSAAVLHFFDQPGCLGSPIVIGGGPIGDAAHVQLPMAPVAGCDQRAAAARTLRVIDFFALAERATCETPAGAGDLAAGLLYRNRFDPFYPVEFYSAAFPEAPAAGVIATTTAFRDAVLTGCPAAIAGGLQFTAAACVYADAPGACAVGGDQGDALELAHVSKSDMNRSLDPALADRWTTAVIGVVVDARRQPIAGAHLFLRNAAAGKLVYTRRDGRTLTPTGGTATDASGTFILYGHGPQRVDVVGGGRTRRLRIGGWATNDPVGSATVITL